MNSTMLWFDLEKTIVEEWEKPFIINEGKIREIIEKIDVRSISIFSFAVYNEKDIATFNRIIKPNIEKTFNVTIENIPTYQDILNTIKNGYKGTHFDEEDFHAFWTKGRAFIDYIRFSTFNKGSHILFDDMVDNWDIEHRSLDISIRNIDKYK